jgi:hypothetical protein
MSKIQGKQILTVAVLLAIGLALVIVLLYQIPAVKTRLSWRVDLAMTYLRGVISPVKPFPTPGEAVVLPTGYPRPPPPTFQPLSPANQPAQLHPPPHLNPAPPPSRLQFSCLPHPGSSRLPTTAARQHWLSTCAITAGTAVRTTSQR